MNSSEAIAAPPARNASYKNRLRSACSGLRTPASRRKGSATHLIDVLTEGTGMSTPEPEMSVHAALVRLEQYQDRPAKTWSTATYTSDVESSLAAIADTLAKAIRSASTRSDVVKQIVDRLASRATLYGSSETVRQVMIDLNTLIAETQPGTSGHVIGEHLFDQITAEGVAERQKDGTSDAHRIYQAIADVLAQWQDADHRAQAELVGVDLPQAIADAVVRQQKTWHADTLAAWIYRRFSDGDAPAWVTLPDEEKDYWEHEANSVRRAVARGGFKDNGADHRPTLVHFGNRHSAPAEVCWGCSDEDAGRWVPVTQCTTARSKMTEGPGSLYASSVVIPHPEGDGHG